MTLHRPLDEADILLIQSVKSTPSLYDPRNGDFRLTTRKEEDWEKVASSLKINPADARRRWTCLRDRYSRELKQVRLNPNRSEYGRNDFFQQMDFLREFVRKRKERSRRDDASGSWSKSAKVAAASAKVELTHSEGELEDNADESQIFEDSETNYENKLNMHGGATSAEAYSMIVEETHEPYEDYGVQPATPSSCNDTKHIGITPIMLTQNIKATSGTPQHQLTTPPVLHHQHQPMSDTLMTTNENEDDFFCKSVAAYLRQLSRRHKIKAKVEMYQILEKYIELEENAVASTGQKS